MTGRSFKWLSVLNFISVGLILFDLYCYIEFCFLTENAQIEYIQGLTNGNYPDLMMVYSNLFVLTMLAYLLVAWVQIRKYACAASDFFSDIERVKVRYIWHLVKLLAILNILLTIAYGAFPTPDVEYFFIPVIILTIYVYIVYYAFSQSAILSIGEYCNLMEDVSSLERFQSFQEPLCKEINEIRQAKEENKSRYRLTEIEIEDNYHKIIQLFEEKKIYLDPAINLTRLSNELNACTHNISLTINIRFNKNFFELINFYRIEEAKNLLSSEKAKQMTIEAIGSDSGFNTKSAFYRAFKKHTGLTPSDFMRLSRN